MQVCGALALTRLAHLIRQTRKSKNEAIERDGFAHGGELGRVKVLLFLRRLLLASEEAQEREREREQNEARKWSVH